MARDPPHTATLRAALRRRLGIDPRALAAFRLSLGLLLLADLLFRARHLRAFYTEAGVLPPDLHAELYPTLSRLSVHAVSGALWVQASLFVLAGVFAALLTVGYRTRLSAAVSWFLLASLQFRNYLVLNGGDTVLLVALFLGLFLPLGARWSVDAARRGPTDQRAPVAGFGTAALLSQVVSIYATNAIFKLRGDAWPSGRAVRRVFALDRFTVFLGDYLAELPALLVAINWGWLALLCASPLLVALVGRPRALLVGCYAGAHLGMSLTMDLGLFPATMGACLVVFLPPFVWDRVESRVAPLARALSAPIDDGRSRGSPVPPPVRRAAGRALPTATATILVVGLVWQAAAVGFVPTPEESPVEPEDHSWKLFAPGPPTTDGWYVVRGELDSGERVDLYPHADTGWDRPPDVAATYPTARWRKYLTELRRGGEPLRGGFADYLCVRGDDRHGEPVAELAITFVEERVRPDGPDERTRVELGTYRCPDA